MTDSSMWPTEADYSWADEWESMGFCVALVEVHSPEMLLRQLVLDPQTQIVPADQAREWAWSQELPDYGTAIEATNADGWAVAVELNGYQATLPQVITRVSMGSRAAVIYRSVNADMSFLWVVDGQVVRWFDPLLYDIPGSGVRLVEEAGLQFGVDHPLASAMACAARLTGIRLTREWLEQRDGWIAVGHHPSPNSR